MTLAWKPGDLVVFAGDSITDAGLVFDGITPWGEGYVRDVIDLLTARYPEHGLTFANTAVAGSTTRHVEERWQRDVLDRRPDWVVLLVGMNDINHLIAGSDVGVPVDEYETRLRRVVTTTIDQCGSRFVMMDSFLMVLPEDADEENAARLELLPTYLAAVRRVAEEAGAIHIPLHDLFEEQLRVRTDGPIGKEPVHPNHRGHLVIAHALLTAIGW